MVLRFLIKFPPINFIFSGNTNNTVQLNHPTAGVKCGRQDLVMNANGTAPSYQFCDANLLATCPWRKFSVPSTSDELLEEEKEPPSE